MCVNRPRNAVFAARPCSPVGPTALRAATHTTRSAPSRSPCVPRACFPCVDGLRPIAVLTLLAKKAGVHERQQVERRAADLHLAQTPVVGWRELRRRADDLVGNAAHSSECLFAEGDDAGRAVRDETR